MPDHFCVSRQTAEKFMRLFVNRLAYGIQRGKPLSDSTVPYIKQTRPLDLGAVRMHLNGDMTINLYAINPLTQSSKWVAIDADYDGSLEALFQLQWELKQDGVEAALEQSRRGGHLWIFGEKPLLASRCRIYIYNLALRLGFPSKVPGSGKESKSSRDRMRSRRGPTAMRFAGLSGCTERTIAATGSMKRTSLPNHN
jgi:TOTE conflict system primase-like protein